MLSGQTVVVTGGAGGIGAAVCRLCAREGARVVVGYLKNQAGAEALAAELPDALARPLDVRDPESIADACRGLERIHGWVNNAGVHHSGLLPTLSLAMIEEQLSTNLMGPIHCSRYILPHMMEHRGGSIVNLGSVASHHVHSGQAVYAASKGGVASLTRALACEYARFAIRVNCVEPGPVETPMLEPTAQRAGQRILERMPLRRLGKPEEVGELVVFLLSERASFLTGGIYSADGGYSL